MKKSILDFYKILASKLFPMEYSKAIVYDYAGIGALRQFFLLNVYHNLPMHEYDVEKCIASFFNSYHYDLQFLSYTEFMDYVFGHLQLVPPGYFGQHWFYTPQDSRSYILSFVNAPIKF